jgi:hypothetical protein
MLAQLSPEERVGDLDEDPGAVAGVRVGALCPAVLKVRHRAQRPLHRLVRGNAVQPGDERHTAGVVLERGVVETGRGGWVDAGWTLGVRQIAPHWSRGRGLRLCC